MQKQLLFIGLFISFFSLQAQVGIGTTTPAPSSALDISSTDSGLLVPRISLTETTDTTTITSPETGLLIFNTGTAGTAPNNVVPGFYFWNGTNWTPFSQGTTWREFSADVPSENVNDRIYHNGQVVLGFERDGAFDGLSLENDFDASSNVQLYAKGNIMLGDLPDTDPIGASGIGNFGYQWNGWRAVWNGDKIAAKIMSDFRPSPGCVDSRVMDMVFSLDNGVIDCANEIDDPTVEAMRLTYNGNLGLGTSTPGTKLDVRGPSSALQTIQSTTAGSGSFTQWYNSDNSIRGIIGTDGVGFSGATNQFSIGTWTNSNLGFYTNATERMRISNAGNVGIGTTTPTQAKLVVSGSESTALTGSFLNSAGTIGTTGGSVTLSGYFFNSVAAETFRAFSDARIKNIEGVSNSEQDLATLAKIEVTDYQLKDTIAKGNKAFKKVIAQQVKKVYPQAVTNDLTDVIPNIYQLSEIKNGVIALSTDLTVGDKVKLIFSEGEELVDVTEVAKNSFKVATKKQGKVFVYGKQVDDFHTVDYEAISMLNVSATQELLKRIEQLETEKESLTAKVSANEERLQEIEKVLFNETAKK